jgi:uncharacterized membrane-anchored protein YjiN (DUF445 family)
MDSDHYRTAVLTRALDKPGLSDISHRRIVESVKEMDSDHYIAEVIKHLMVNKLSDAALSGFVDILSSMESDHYRTEILKRMLDRQELTEVQFAAILAACVKMDSDHYRTEILKRAVSRTGSDKMMLEVLSATGEVDSDHYLTEVLLSVAPKIRNGSEKVKDAYRASAKNISSETYYGRAIRAIE